MKTEELKALGIEDDVAQKIFELNGKDIKAEQKKTEKAEQERDSWKARAESAEETLKGFDGVDVDKLNKDIEDWKARAEKAEKDAEAKILARDQRDYLNAEFDKLDIKSERTRKSLMADIMGEDGLKWKDGAFMGLSDYLGKENEKDHFFLTDEEKKQKEADDNKPKFTEPKPKDEHKPEAKPVPKVW